MRERAKRAIASEIYIIVMSTKNDISISIYYYYAATMHCCHRMLVKLTCRGMYLSHPC